MVPGVEGSSPFTHPTEYQGLGAIPIPDSFSTQGCSQVVRQGTLTPSSAGSSPAIPATPFRMAPSFFHMCHAPLAQSVEHLPFKQGVRGSNPRRGTKSKPVYPQWICGFSFIFKGFRHLCILRILKEICSSHAYFTHKLPMKLPTKNRALVRRDDPLKKTVYFFGHGLLLV